MVIIGLILIFFVLFGFLILYFFLIGLIKGNITYTYRFPDGSSMVCTTEDHKGKLENNAIMGERTIKTSQGVTIEGVFKNGKSEGESLIHYPNGKTYSGTFDNGVITLNPRYDTKLHKLSTLFTEKNREKVYIESKELLKTITYEQFPQEYDLIQKYIILAEREFFINHGHNSILDQTNEKHQEGINETFAKILQIVQKSGVNNIQNIAQNERLELISLVAQERIAAICISTILLQNYTNPEVGAYGELVLQNTQILSSQYSYDYAVTLGLSSLVAKPQKSLSEKALLTYLSKALTIRPNDCILLCSVGHLAGKHLDYDTAFSTLKKALSLLEDKTTLSIENFTQLTPFGDTGNTTTTIQNTKENLLDHARLLYGGYLLKKGKAHESIGIIKQVSQRTPRLRSESIVTLGHAYKKTKQWNEILLLNPNTNALKEYSSSLGSDLLYMCAIAHVQIGEYEKGLEIISIIILLDPDRKKHILVDHLLKPLSTYKKDWKSLLNT